MATRIVYKSFKMLNENIPAFRVFKGKAGIVINNCIPTQIRVFQGIPLKNRSIQGPGGPD